MRTKQDKLIFIIYTALILYFLFFSFGRLDWAVESNNHSFNLIPRNVYLRFPIFSTMGFLIMQMTMKVR